MDSNKVKIYLFASVLLLITLACSTSFSTANIAEAWMSLDMEGNNRTTTFNDAATFFVQVELQNAPDDTSLKVVWIAENVDDVDPEFVMNEYEYIGGDSGLYFDLTNDALWPSGTYRVDLYLNGTLDQSLNFSVN